MPPAYIADADGRPMHSWRVLLLPFLDQNDLYKQYRFDEPWNGPHNRKLMSARPRIYALNDEVSQQGQETNYLAIVGQDTSWPGAGAYKPLRDEAKKQSPIMVVENVGSGISWLEPRDLVLDAMDLSMAAESSRGISSRYQPPAVVTVNGDVLTLPLDLAPEALRKMLVVTNPAALKHDPNVKRIDDGRDRPLKGSATAAER